MNRTLQLLAVLMTGGFMASTSAWGQPVYATPYTITTIAGTAGSPGNANGNNGAGTFGNPEGVVVATNGSLYVVDNNKNTVRQVSPAGGTNWSVTTIAGSGAAGSLDANGLSATFNQPTSIAMDVSNNLYVMDANNGIVRKLTFANQTWAVTTISGTANPGNGGFADGTNGAAQYNYPEGIAADAAGNLYVADTFNQAIRKITPVGTNWVATTIAGVGGLFNFGSSDGTNQSAQFFFPAGIVVDRSGTLYVADGGNNTIRKIVPVGTNWVVSTIAGVAFSGNGGFVDGTNGDAQFRSPGAITVDASGNLYVTDINNNAIREVSPVGTNWVTTTLAGFPDGSAQSTNGTGPTAGFYNPDGIAVDATGNLFISDTFNSTMRKGFLAAIPNPTIAVSGGNTVVVSWAGSGGTLQTNADLSSTNWGMYGGQISSNNGTNSVSFSPAAGSLYFRLTR